MIHSIVGPYTLIKYPPEKKYDPLYRNRRSVIYKGDTLVCMSPGKSIPLDETIPVTDYTVEDFVEGIMINAFYDDGWKIATKSNIGANCTFDSTRTFAELFDDCKAAVGLSLDTLNPEFSYSFVMKHPDHRIVTPVTQPTLTCVAKFAGKEEKGILRFQLSGVDKSFANAIRRTLLGNIPIQVMKSEDCVIHTNITITLS